MHYRSRNETERLRDGRAPDGELRWISRATSQTPPPSIAKSGRAEFVVELALDLALDDRLQGAHQEAELGMDVHVGLGDADRAADAQAREMERVAVPVVGDPVFVRDCVGDALDGGLGLLHGAAMLAVNVDGGHRRLPV